MPENYPLRKLQFRVLYRVFLLRVVDLELLSTDGDTTKLLGQFAALFAAVSFMLTAPLVLFGGGFPQIDILTMEHFLIATTMVVIGLFSVLNWDSIFPDHRDCSCLRRCRPSQHAFSCQTGSIDFRNNPFRHRSKRVHGASLARRDFRPTRRCPCSLPIGRCLLDYHTRCRLLHLLFRISGARDDCLIAAPPAILTALGSVAGSCFLPLRRRLYPGAFAARPSLARDT